MQIAPPFRLLTCSKLTKNGNLFAYKINNQQIYHRENNTFLKQFSSLTLLHSLP